MHAFIGALATAVSLLFFSSLALETAHLIKVTAVKRIAKGLSSSESFAQKLTGQRFNEKFELVPLKESEAKR